MMSNQNEKISTPQQQRVFRPNPAVRTREATTQKRRDMFFRRVQKGRDDKKWDARGEQVREYSHIKELSLLFWRVTYNSLDSTPRLHLRTQALGS
jgi:hypothetical protein